MTPKSTILAPTCWANRVCTLWSAGYAGAVFDCVLSESRSEQTEEDTSDKLRIGVVPFKDGFRGRIWTGECLLHLSHCRWLILPLVDELEACFLLGARVQYGPEPAPDDIKLCIIYCPTPPTTSLLNQFPRKGGNISTLTHNKKSRRKPVPVTFRVVGEYGHPEATTYLGCARSGEQ